MTKLWVPNATRYPDPHNFFDLTLAMQEALTGIQDLDLRVHHAQFAIEALGEQLSGLDPHERELSLQSSTVAYESTVPVHIEQIIGIRGELNDISYDSFEPYPGMPLGLSLGISAHEIFTPSNPDVPALTKTSFLAPIACVKYVEFTAEPINKPF